MTTDGDDRADLALIVTEDPNGVERLYRRHAAALLSFIRSIVRSHGVAEEVLQDTFVAVWGSAASFEGRSKVKTWLYTIAYRRALNAIRGRSHLATDIDRIDLASTEPGPAAHVVARASVDEVVACLPRLSDEHREVLVLCFAAQMSYGDMAEVLTVPVGTVKSRINAARRELRDLVAVETSGHTHG